MMCKLQRVLYPNRLSVLPDNEPVDHFSVDVELQQDLLDFFLQQA